jgi:hypothetical protein
VTDYLVRYWTERRIVGLRWFVTVDGNYAGRNVRVDSADGWCLRRGTADDRAYTAARAIAFTWAADDEGAAS